MAITKKVIKTPVKTPSVMVETKKLSAKDTCGIGCCSNIKHVVVFALVVLNTLMLAWILCNQTRLEADKVGGRANYKMVQQIYKSDMFKAQQTQQIEQALQMYQQGTTQTPDITTDTTTTLPVTAE